jgi:hypothetical protein
MIQRLKYAYVYIATILGVIAEGISDSKEIFIVGATIVGRYVLFGILFGLLVGACSTIVWIILNLLEEIHP